MSSTSHTVRVVLPSHLKVMAQVSGEVQVEVGDEVTQRAVLDALEAEFPALLGTIRDRATSKPLPFEQVLLRIHLRAGEPGLQLGAERRLGVLPRTDLQPEIVRDAENPRGPFHLQRRECQGSSELRPF